ncbi:MAG: DUF4382 domain-containing protein [Acidobacteriia bacterium]|nr:DUF4382 domain-containing protein [Terriglobia bacterium]
MALALSSCSGYWYNPGGGTGGGGTPPPPPTTTLNLTLQDAPPANTSIASFKVTITGVALNPVGGGAAVNLTLSPNPYVVELTRLASDSAFLGSFTVPSGSYSSITVTVANPDITFANQSGSTVTGCLTGSVCEITPAAAGSLTVSTSPFPLTLSASGQSGLALDFNLNNALTATAGDLGVDFTAADVLSASALPHTGMPSGTLDLLEDFTGTVTAVSSSSITVQSETRGTLTGTLNSSTVYHDPLSTCVALDSTCLHTGQTLSVDAALNLNGSLTIRSVDLLDTTSVDEIEGTVVLTGPPPSTQFNLVLSDKVVASGNASLSSAVAGNIVLVTLSATPAFQVDTGGLTVPPASLSLFQGGSDTSVLFNGQTVMVRVTAAAGSSGAGNLTATVDRVLLRYTRTTAAVTGAVASPYFYLDAATLPPYFGILNTAQVQIFPNVTNYDGVNDVTGLVSGDIVSVRALYIKSAAPPFLAAKVRKH